MARVRMIKPEFFDDPDIGDVSPMARLLFIGMWLEADKEGRLIDDMRRLKAQVFPYDAIGVADVESLAVELHCKDMIRRYQAGERHDRFIWIRNFTKHQHPHPREAKSLIPPCENGDGRRLTQGEPLHVKPCNLTEGTSVFNSNSDPNSESDPESNSELLRSSVSRTEKAPSDLPGTMAHYHDGYLARFHEKPNINGAKDGKLLKTLLAKHGKDAVWQRIDNMLRSRDAFIQGSGCTIGILSSQWNKLRTTDSATGKTAGNLAALTRFAQRKSV